MQDINPLEALLFLKKINNLDRSLGANYILLGFPITQT